jgi:DNA-binding NarL/FixJ family response regulator
LGLLAQGMSNKEIAGVLWLSDRTIERHITGLYRKIGAHRRTEAAAFALRHGLIDPDPSGM